MKNKGRMSPGRREKMVADTIRDVKGYNAPVALCMWLREHGYVEAADAWVKDLIVKAWTTKPGAEGFWSIAAADGLGISVIWADQYGTLFVMYYETKAKWTVIGRV